MKTRDITTFITETERQVPVVAEADVVVAGAGPAGIAAALAASRAGARVCLLEAHGCLGGVWTAGLQLVATCEQIGVREGRRIHGRYTVTQADLAAGRVHEDAVCRVHFGVDIHSTNGAASKGQDATARGVTMQPYDIPMRALVAREVSNLLLGGRCISGDFIAHSSYRVTGTAAATGQAAGVAAALCAARDTAPADLPWTLINKALKKITR